MSLIIKGMELSKSCDSCDLIQFDDEGFEAHCPLSPYYRWCGTPPDYKPEGCRLVELPTPHGRLIDADRLLAVLKSMASTNESVPTTAVLELIDHQPVVLKAEVSE